ncbi:hypothetical protein AURDEDRAFT_164133 [Auricularia subglabra TFB-10046 SS5]|nr:hypothetical protein AURDEDRAFT_164133 [Auricularia subglabra TFB-10046 SS5]
MAYSTAELDGVDEEAAIEEAAARKQRMLDYARDLRFVADALDAHVNHDQGGDVWLKAMDKNSALAAVSELAGDLRLEDSTGRVRKTTTSDSSQIMRAHAWYNDAPRFSSLHPLLCISLRLSATCTAKLLGGTRFGVLRADLESTDPTYVVRYYRSCVAGQVYVIRIIEKDAYLWRAAEERSRSYLEDLLFQHDLVLEQISPLRSRHPNIARLYARSEGNIIDRCPIIISGAIPIGSCLASMSLGELSAVAMKVLDATRFLEENGATWDPRFADSIFLDDQGKPTIGLRHDLRPVGPEGWETRCFVQVLGLVSLFKWTRPSWINSSSPAWLASHGFPDSRFDGISTTSTSFDILHAVIPRTHLSTHKMTQKTYTARCRSVSGTSLSLPVRLNRDNLDYFFVFQRDTRDRRHRKR